MSDENIQQQMYSLMKESCERDARIETQLTYMDKRLSNQEELLSKMSETLNEQKHLSSVVDQLAITVASNTKRITELEQKEQKVIAGAFKKYAGIFFTVIVTAIATYVVSKLGFGK